MTLKTKSLVNSQMNNNILHQQQEGGGVFNLTSGLSSNNLKLVENYRKDRLNQSKLIDTINTVLNNNGITDRLNTNTKKISKSVSNIITRKVRGDCAKKEITRQKLAAKLQREFLEYLKGLGTDGKPLQIKAQTPVRQQQSSKTRQTFGPSTSFTMIKQAANQRYEQAQQELQNAENLAQEAKQKVQQIERETAEKANIEAKLEHIQGTFETAQSDLHSILDELSGGNMSQELIKNLKEFAQMIIALSGELDTTTARAANVSTSDLTTMANTVKQVVAMVEAGTNTDTISSTLETVEQTLEINTDEIKKAEQELSAEVEQLKQKQQLLEQQQAELEATAQNAKEEQLKAEAVAKAANEKATKAEAALQEAKKQSANNRTAREASNAKAAKLEQELAELKKKQAEELEELEKILQANKSELPQTVVAAQNNAIQNIAEIDSNTAKLVELNQKPEENAEEIKPLEEQTQQLNIELQEKITNIAADIKAYQASGNTPANNKAVNFATNLVQRVNSLQQVNEEITTIQAVLNEVAEQAVNKGNTDPTNKKPGNASSFNFVNPNSEQEENTPDVSIEQKGPETANPEIAFDTHTAEETKAAQQGQETDKKPENKTPSSSNKAKNMSNMQVALVIPTAATTSTSTNKSTNKAKPKTEAQAKAEEHTEEVILALAPNTAGTSQLPKLETAGSGEYLGILPAGKGNQPLPLEIAHGSGEYFDVGSGENNPATGGRKMTWSAVKRYFTPKKHHTKSKKSRQTLKVISKKH